MNEVTVVDVKPQLVLGMRKRGKYEQIGEMLPKVFEFVIAKGIEIAGMPTFVCHEMTPEEAMKADEEGNADVEVAVPVAQKTEGTGEITCYELSGGKMARIIHRGPYMECGVTYEKLYAWIAENKKKITGPMREIYLNDPNEVPQEEILTEIYAPID